MILWVVLFFVNMFAFVANLLNGNAFFAALSALGVVFCLKKLIPVKEEKEE